MKTYTFAMIKPDAIEGGLSDLIIKRITDAGFQIEIVGCVKASTDIMKKHHWEAISKYGDNFVQQLEKAFDGRYVMPILLSTKNDKAISLCRKIIGVRDPAESVKGTIRGDFGIDSWEKSVEENRYCNNLIHASDSKEAFFHETKLWFHPSIMASLFEKLVE